jgi:hypothetical protein
MTNSHLDRSPTRCATTRKSRPFLAANRVSSLIHHGRITGVVWALSNTVESSGPTRDCLFERVKPTCDRLKFLKPTCDLFGLSFAPVIDATREPVSKKQNGRKAAGSDSSLPRCHPDHRVMEETLVHGHIVPILLSERLCHSLDRGARLQDSRPPWPRHDRDRGTGRMSSVTTPPLRGVGERRAVVRRRPRG